jgi:transposase
MTFEHEQEFERPRTENAELRQTLAASQAQVAQATK